MTEIKPFLQTSNIVKVALFVILCIVAHLEYEHWKSKGVSSGNKDSSIKVIVDNNEAMGAEINRLAEEVHKQSEKIQKQRDMITLLGACNNENFTATKNGDKNYMIINPNWTVNHYPNYIQLDDESRSWFGKFVEGPTGSITNSVLGSPMPGRTDE